MKTIYMKIPVISDEMMTLLRTSESSNRSENKLGKVALIDYLREEIPSATTFSTKFAHAGKTYYIDMDGYTISGWDSCYDYTANMLQDQPDPVVIQVAKPTGISEDLFLKTLATVMHENAIKTLI